MVHALREAHRVLKPDGILIDLRPGAVHRRVAIVRGGSDVEIGTMREPLDDDRAANQAVAEVLRLGLFHAEGRAQFRCRRVMDSLADFHDFLEEFTTLGIELPSHDWLFRRVQRALGAARGQEQIVVWGPLVMRVLRKLEVGE